MEEVYLKSRDNNLNVLPLVMSLSSLTPNVYSMYDDRKLLLAAQDRLQCDAVILFYDQVGFLFKNEVICYETVEKLVAMSRHLLIVQFDRLSSNLEKSTYSSAKLLSLMDLLRSFGFVVQLISKSVMGDALLICRRD